MVAHLTPPCSMKSAVVDYASVFVYCLARHIWGKRKSNYERESGSECFQIKWAKMPQVNTTRDFRSGD